MSRSTTDPDDAIRSTDDDAAASRLSAVTLGYLADPYTTLLYKPPRDPAPFGPGPSSSSTRKAPLINVGTHHRTLAIDLLVQRFLDRADGHGQVVSLGAGSDSRFWRLSDKGARMSRYVEVDFPHLTSLKAQRIARSPKLSAKLAAADPSSSSWSTANKGGTTPTSSRSANTTPTTTPRSDPSPSDPSSAPAPPSSSHVDPSPNAPSGSMLPPTGPSKPYTIAQSGSSLLSPVYALIPLDLRHNPSASLSDALIPHLDTTRPVLFIAECVFCYMTPRTSEEIIRWFGETFARAAGVVYEMCGLTDTFGQVMRRNLAARGLSLPGSEPFPDVASQAQRFVSPALGPGAFERSGAKSLWEIRQEVIDPAELARISKLEFLDEIEELRLVLGHYCVAWGSKGLPEMGL